MTKFKLVAEIYFDDKEGETKIVWKQDTLDNLECYPTSHLDLATDIINETQLKFTIND
jgi:hypothetical protein